MGYRTGAHRLGLVSLAAVLLGSGLTVRPVAAAQLPQERDITLIPGTVELDPALEQAIAGLLATLDAPVGDAIYFAATDLRLADPWALTSVAGFASLGPDWTWHAEDGAWFGQVLARRDESGAWQAAIEGTEGFTTMLADVPSDFLYPGFAGDQPARELLAASTYPVIFPWETGAAMIYGPLGLHDGGSGWKAVDMATDGDTSRGHAPHSAVAATAGTVDYICKDGLSVMIRFGGFKYLHLLDNPGLFSGRSFAQGDLLGQLKTGSFSGPCGYATQPSTWSHLHWAFPNADLHVEDWTLSVSTGLWSNGTSTAAPGRDWIVARPSGGTPAQVWISGNAGVAGATLSFFDGEWRTGTADAAGDYRIAVSEGWSGTLAPYHAFHVFSPAFRTYVDLLSEQVAQDFEVRQAVSVGPADGATVCRTPRIEVSLAASEAALGADGGLNPSAIDLKLDGASVLPLSTVRVSQMVPVVRAHISYVPQTRLGAGTHSLQFTHAEASGPITDAWSFLAADIACAEAAPLSSAGEVGGGEAQSGATSTSLSAVMAPLSSAVEPEPSVAASAQEPAAADPEVSLVSGQAAEGPAGEMPLDVTQEPTIFVPVEAPSSPSVVQPAVATTTVVVSSAGLPALIDGAPARGSLRWTKGSRPALWP